MPTYEFECRDGSIIERDYGMHDQKPPMGEWVTLDGVECRRIFASGVGGAEQVANRTWGWPRVAVQGPKDIPGWKHYDKKTGRPVIPSPTHEREYLAATGRERDW